MGKAIHKDKRRLGSQERGRHTLCLKGCRHAFMRLMIEEWAKCLNSLAMTSV